MQTGKYIQDAVNSNVINDPSELVMFNQVMAFILENIKVPPAKEVVYEALSKAPYEIIEWLANDKWWACQPDPKQVPIYSVVAREILMERIILGDTVRK